MNTLELIYGSEKYGDTSHVHWPGGSIQSVFTAGRRWLHAVSANDLTVERTAASATGRGRKDRFISNYNHESWV